jgi:hypothetical protein
MPDLQAGYNLIRFMEVRGARLRSSGAEGLLQ